MGIRDNNNLESGLPYWRTIKGFDDFAVALMRPQKQNGGLGAAGPKK